MPKTKKKTKKRNINPLRIDPTRTTTLRNDFIADLNRRFRALRKASRQLIVEEDAFGLIADRKAAKNTITPTQTATTRALPLDDILQNTRFRFATDDAKVAGYQEWLKEQVDAGILEVSAGATETPWTEKYIGSAYRKGRVRAYTDSMKIGAGDFKFIDGGKKAFIEQSFASPVAQSKLKMLNTRTYTHLKGMTAQMDSEVSRVLTQGMAAGHGAEQIARDLDKSIAGINRKRARVIARTEIVHAHNEGQLDAFEEFNVEGLDVMAEWSTAHDDKVCPMCQPMEGVTFTVQEARGMIPRHPNCRCAWIPANVGEDLYGTTKTTHAGPGQDLEEPGTLPTGKTTGQVRAKGTIQDRIRQSIRAENPKLSLKDARAASRWVGADAKITGKVAPGSVAAKRASAAKEKAEATGTAVVAARKKKAEKDKKKKEEVLATKEKPQWEMTADAFAAQEGVYFHATTTDEFTHFSKRKFGSATDEGLLGEGVYLSTDKNIAHKNQNRISVVVLGEQNLLKVQATSWGMDKSKLVNDAIGTEGLSGKALTKELKKRGYTGVELDYSPLEYYQKEVVIFDPDQAIPRKGIIEKALQDGHKVPDNVLDDYPDLKVAFVTKTDDAISTAPPPPSADTPAPPVVPPKLTATEFHEQNKHLYKHCKDSKTPEGIVCHQGVAEIEEAIGRPPGVQYFYWGEDLWDDFADAIDIDVVKATLKDQAAINLFIDIKDKTVLGHSFIKIGDHYIDPFLYSQGTSQAQIDKAGELFEAIYRATGMDKNKAYGVGKGLTKAPAEVVIDEKKLTDWVMAELAHHIEKNPSNKELFESHIASALKQTTIKEQVDYVSAVLGLKITDEVLGKIKVVKTATKPVRSPVAPVIDQNAFKVWVFDEMDWYLKVNPQDADKILENVEYILARPTLAEVVASSEALLNLKVTDDVLAQVAKVPTKSKTPIPRPPAPVATPEADAAKTIKKWNNQPGYDESTLDMADYSVVDGWTPDPGKSQSYGIVIFDDGGKVLLREPTNHYGGTHWTFAKGGGDLPASTALAELGEETGYTATIHGIIPGKFKGSTTDNNYFLGRPAGYDAALMDTETQAVKWVSYEEAVQHINLTTNEAARTRDLAILDAAYAQMKKPNNRIMQKLDDSGLKKWEELHEQANYAKNKLDSDIMDLKKKWQGAQYGGGLGEEHYTAKGNLLNEAGVDKLLAAKGWNLKALPDDISLQIMLQDNVVSQAKIIDDLEPSLLLKLNEELPISTSPGDWTLGFLTMKESGLEKVLAAKGHTLNTIPAQLKDDMLFAGKWSDQQKALNKVEPKKGLGVGKNLAPPLSDKGEYIDETLLADYLKEVGEHAQNVSSKVESAAGREAIVKRVLEGDDFYEQIGIIADETFFVTEQVLDDSWAFVKVHPKWIGDEAIKVATAPGTKYIDTELLKSHLLDTVGDAIGEEMIDFVVGALPLMKTYDEMLDFIATQTGVSKTSAIEDAWKYTFTQAGTPGKKIRIKGAAKLPLADDVADLTDEAVELTDDVTGGDPFKLTEVGLTGEIDPVTGFPLVGGPGVPRGTLAGQTYLDKDDALDILMDEISAAGVDPDFDDIVKFLDVLESKTPAGPLYENVGEKMEAISQYYKQQTGIDGFAVFHAHWDDIVKKAPAADAIPDTPKKINFVKLKKAVEEVFDTASSEQLYEFVEKVKLMDGGYPAQIKFIQISSDKLAKMIPDFVEDATTKKINMAKLDKVTHKLYDGTDFEVDIPWFLDDVAKQDGYAEQIAYIKAMQPDLVEHVDEFVDTIGGPISPVKAVTAFGRDPSPDIKGGVSKSKFFEWMGANTPYTQDEIAEFYKDVVEFNGDLMQKKLFVLKEVDPNNVMDIQPSALNVFFPDLEKPPITAPIPDIYDTVRPDWVDVGEAYLSKPHLKMFIEKNFKEKMFLTDDFVEQVTDDIYQQGTYIKQLLKFEEYFSDDLPSGYDFDSLLKDVIFYKKLEDIDKDMFNQWLSLRYNMEGMTPGDLLHGDVIELKRVFLAELAQGTAGVDDVTEVVSGINKKGLAKWLDEHIKPLEGDFDTDSVIDEEYAILGDKYTIIGKVNAEHIDVHGEHLPDTIIKQIMPDPPGGTDLAALTQQLGKNTGDQYIDEPSFKMWAMAVMSNQKTPKGIKRQFIDDVLGPLEFDEQMKRLKEHIGGGHGGDVHKAIQSMNASWNFPEDFTFIKTIGDKSVVDAALDAVEDSFELAFDVPKLKKFANEIGGGTVSSSIRKATNKHIDDIMADVTTTYEEKVMLLVQHVAVDETDLINEGLLKGVRKFDGKASGVPTGLEDGDQYIDKEKLSKWVKEQVGGFMDDEELDYIVGDVLFEKTYTAQLAALEEHLAMDGSLGLEHVKAFTKVHRATVGEKFITPITFKKWMIDQHASSISNEGKWLKHAEDVLATPGGWDAQINKLAEILKKPAEAIKQTDAKNWTIIKKVPPTAPGAGVPWDQKVMDQDLLAKWLRGRVPGDTQSIKTDVDNMLSKNQGFQEQFDALVGWVKWHDENMTTPKMKEATDYFTISKKAQQIKQGGPDKIVDDRKLLNWVLENKTSDMDDALYIVKYVKEVDEYDKQLMKVALGTQTPIKEIKDLAHNFTSIVVKKKPFVNMTKFKQYVDEVYGGKVSKKAVDKLLEDVAKIDFTNYQEGIDQIQAVIPKLATKEAVEYYTDYIGGRAGFQTLLPNVEELRYVEDLNGSTRPWKAADAAKRHWVVKDTNRSTVSVEHLRSEGLADSLYRTMKIAVPEGGVIESPEGPVKVAKFIDGGQTLGEWKAGKSASEVKDMYKQIQRGFVADALLANHDVAGQTMDNILIAGGRAYRIDNGGALTFRAQGAPKGTWGTKVQELDGLRDAGLNPNTAEIFADITDEEIHEQIRKIVARKDEILASINDPGIRATMAGRIDNLKAKLPARQVRTETPTGRRRANYGITTKTAKEADKAQMNGVNVAIDAEHIEDHNMLVFPEVSEQGENVTRIHLKLTKEGSDAVLEQIDVPDSINQRVISANETLDVTANRLRNSINDWLQSGLTEMDEGETKASEQKMLAIEELIENFKDYVNDVPSMTGWDTKAQGVVDHWTEVIKRIERSFEDAEEIAPIAGYKLKQVVPTSKTKKKYAIKKEDGSFRVNEFDRGRGRTLSGEYNTKRTGEVTRLTDEDGIEIEFYPNQGQRHEREGLALEGTVMVNVPEAMSDEAIAKAMTVLEDIGINTKQVSLADEELLYLHRGVYINNKHRNASYQDLYTNPDMSSEEKIPLIKEWINNNMGIDVDTRPNYDPHGISKNSDGSGYRHWLRWDLSEEELFNDMSEYNLVHTTGGLHQSIQGRIPITLDAVLNSGGEFTSTTGRYRKGVPIFVDGNQVGDSVGSDIDSGGASYLFTRIYESKDTHKKGFFFKITNLARQDAVSYDGDKFGRITDYEKRYSTIKKYREISQLGGNETIFKEGLNIMDDLDYIRVYDDTEYRDVVKAFHKHGIKQLNDGRKVEDIIVIGDQPRPKVIPKP